MAMMMAIGFMLVAGVIVATALSYATSLQPRAVNGQDRVEALSAAQAGIDHYLGHLNQDRNYFATPDCDNPALEGPNPDPAWLIDDCGWDADTPVGWVKVQPDDPNSAEFHYDVDSRQMDQFTIWVSSTGRAGNVERTLQAKVTIAGSQRYLYVTDFEDADPANQYVYPLDALKRPTYKNLSTLLDEHCCQGHHGQVLVAASGQPPHEVGEPWLSGDHLRIWGCPRWAGPLQRHPAHQRECGVQAGLHHVCHGLPQDRHQPRPNCEGRRVLPRDRDSEAEHQGCALGEHQPAPGHNRRHSQQARMPVHR